MKKDLTGPISILITVLFFSAVVFSQTTEFTYQGRLLNASAPATGNYDFEFALYDTVSAGLQFGSTLTRSSVAVANGDFSVKLDFGSQFPGASRFLEIRVRQTGGVAFTPLTPRQQVNSSPYAVQSLNANSATNATNATNAVNANTATNATQLGGVAANQYVTATSGNASYIQNTTTQQAISNFNISGNGIVGGKLGIGTAPSYKLHIVDSINQGLRVQTNEAGGTVATFGGTGDFQIDAPGIVGGRFIVLENGNVGIGLGTTIFPANPNFKLQVEASSNAGLRVLTNATGGSVASFGSNGAFQIDAPGIFGGRFNVAESGEISFGTLGGAGSTQLCRNSSNQIATCSSSIRYKQNINPFNQGLSLIKQLRPVSFSWRANNQADLGLVAEEVGAVEPLLTTVNDKGEIEGVKYDRVGVVLVNAVQEQQAQIESLEKRNQSQQTQIDEQNQLIKLQKEKLENAEKQMNRQKSELEALKVLVCSQNPTAELCKPKE